MLRLKHGWFHLKLYLIFEDLSWRSIETGFGGRGLNSLNSALFSHNVITLLKQVFTKKCTLVFS